MDRKMIPPVRTWNVRVWSDDGKIVTNVAIDTVSKTLARIIFRQDYMQFWGYKITISLAKKQASGYTKA
jgi:hypothetical protein